MQTDSRLNNVIRTKWLILYVTSGGCGILLKTYRPLINSSICCSTLSLITLSIYTLC